MKLALNAVVALVLLVGTYKNSAQAQEEFNIITIETCQPGSQCTENCTVDAVVNQGQCYQPDPTKSLAFQANCTTAPGVCVEVDFYSDTSCYVPKTTMNAVCSSCQIPPQGPGFFYIECGALPDGVFLVYNCTDDYCGNCNQDKVVTFGQCQNVNGLNFVVRRPTDCRTVELTRFNNLECTGNGTSFQYPDGICSQAATVSCSTSPTQAPFPSMP